MIYRTEAEAETAAAAANAEADERTVYGTEPVGGGYAVATLRKQESGWSLEEEGGEVVTAAGDTMEHSEQQLETVEADARAKAITCLPCPECGSNAAPVKRKPPRESPEWWDDPSVYFGCADCGRYLADLPIVAPYIWEPDAPPADADSVSEPGLGS